VRASTIEAQLDQVSAQLRDLQDVQTRLQTRNILLEKLVELNKQAGPPSGPSVLPDNAVSLFICLRQLYHCVPCLQPLPEDFSPHAADGDRLVQIKRIQGCA
jgi:hypothetical protein